MKRLLSLLIMVVLVLAPVGSVSVTAQETPELEPYAYELYFNYDWWELHEWGADAVSAYYKDKYNVDITFTRPDPDTAEARLNLMIASDELPDAIWMDRDATNLKMARMGLFQSLDQYPEAMKILTEQVLPTTREELSIDGKLYGIPNWSRKEASGGNYTWLYDTRLYELAGSPKLETLDDMYDYAVKVRDMGKTPEGLSVIPMLTDFFEHGDGWRLAHAFYRSYGGVCMDGLWYAPVDGKLQFVLRDPVMREATMEINRWWRDGLIGETQFTDTESQVTEKIVNGRAGLMWYDFSHDEYNKFRTILKRTIPGDDVALVKPFPYPPAKGLSTDKIYADFQSTLGWNVTCITKKAEHPERIAEMWADFLTREGVIINMYGPQGIMWDELDADGLPILKKPESEWTEDEIDELGAWIWLEQCGQSDNVDGIKFAINNKLPEDKRNWIISNQSDYLTPLMWCTDEFENIVTEIESTSEEGIARTLCEDYIYAQYPKIVMAATVEEAEALYDDLISYCDQYGMPKVEEIFNAKYQDNVQKYGTGVNK